jgi:homopolymeric O-antigen transport system permease protein
LKLWRHRSLLTSLTRRQFQLRYRQSVAGVFWAAVPPLVTVFASTLVFNQVAGLSSGVPGVPYPLFVFSAITPWTFFAGSVSFGVPSVASNQPMVARLAFPRAVLPLSMVGLSLVDFAIASGTFVIYLYAIGHSLPATVVWIPLLLAIEILFASGIVLFASALNMFARDVKLAIPFVMQLWLFLTPVLYPLEQVPESLRPLYLANPMTGIVESFRDVLVVGRAPDLELLGPSLFGAAVAIVLGIWYFHTTESRFADVI